MKSNFTLISFFRTRLGNSTNHITTFFILINNTPCLKYNLPFSLAVYVQIPLEVPSWCTKNVIVSQQRISSISYYHEYLRVTRNKKPELCLACIYPKLLGKRKETNQFSFQEMTTVNSITCTIDQKHSLICSDTL